MQEQQQADTPVARKLWALGNPHVESLETLYREAFEKWRASLVKQNLGGLVLDYDGTICAVEDRASLPAASVQAEIVRVVEGGLRLGFASGRGKSMYDALRSWIPRHLWSRVLLGPYSGRLRLRLSNEWPRLATSPVIEEAHRRLMDSPIIDWIRINLKPAQITLFAREECPLDIPDLLLVVRGILWRDPRISVRVVSSGQAVDVMETGSSKAAVLNDLGKSCKGVILAIGDQGQPGGNDFELLAASRWSMSVDHCSADPTRCWAVSTTRGPQALEFILDRLEIDGSGRLDLPIDAAVM